MTVGSTEHEATVSGTCGYSSSRPDCSCARPAQAPRPWSPPGTRRATASAEPGRPRRARSSGPLRPLSHCRRYPAPAPARLGRPYASSATETTLTSSVLIMARSQREVEGFSAQVEAIFSQTPEQGTSTPLSTWPHAPVFVGSYLRYLKTRTL